LLADLAHDVPVQIDALTSSLKSVVIADMPAVPVKCRADVAIGELLICGCPEISDDVLLQRQSLYAVLRELQDCPERERAELIEKYPGMTKAQARAYAKNAKGESNKTDRTPEAAMKRNNKRWLREVWDAATAADDCAAQIVRLAGTCTGWEPELRAAMRANVMEPDKLFQKLEDSAAALIDAGKLQQEFVEFLKQVLSEEEDDEADLGEENEPRGPLPSSPAAEATAAPVA
jgi:hypothetical protein